MSKKNLLAMGCAVVFAAIMAFNVNLSSSNNSMTDIALANIEALAIGENGDGPKALARKTNGDYCCVSYDSETCSPHDAPDC